MSLSDTKLKIRKLMKINFDVLEEIKILNLKFQASRYFHHSWWHTAISLLSWPHCHAYYAPIDKDLTALSHPANTKTTEVIQVKVSKTWLSIQPATCQANVAKNVNTRISHCQRSIWFCLNLQQQNRKGNIKRSNSTKPHKLSTGRRHTCHSKAHNVI